MLLVGRPLITLNTLNKFLNTILLGFAVRQALGYKLKKRDDLWLEMLSGDFNFLFSSEVKTNAGKTKLDLYPS